jgi:fumarate hydratase class II
MDRFERDTFGEIAVPEHALWGAQTQRSLHHFDISSERMPPELLRALALVKRSAAVVNRELGTLDAAKADAIVQAADEVLAGKHDGQFPAVAVADRFGHAEQHEHERGDREPRIAMLGGEVGEGRLVHPNDDVKRSQSSNDVFPTAMSVAGRAHARRAAAAGAGHAARHARSEVRCLRRRREDRPHASAGRDAA